MKPLRVALIIPDNRDERRQYDRSEPEFGPAPAALLKGLETCPHLEVHVLATTRQPMPAPAKLGQNIHYHLLPVGAWGGLRGLYLPSLIALRKAIRRLQPDLVHGQGTERYCALAAAFSGRPNVVTVHGNMRAIARLYPPRRFTYGWWTARLETLALRRTHGVICLSRHSLREVQDHARRLWLLPNAVDPAFFSVQRKPVSPPALLYVANIVPLKNHLRLLEALEPLTASHTFQLKLAGAASPDDPWMLSLRERLQRAPWCLHDGFWDRQRLLHELAAATLLVHPSLEDNCPMAILEAMAAGVPVAASRVGGIPDLIEHRWSGVLFDPNNPENLRAAVRELLDRPSWREDLARRAHALAGRKHTPEVIAAGHCRIYRELLAAGS